MAAAAAAVPLNITLSIGNVSFHLTPSSSSSSSNAAGTPLPLSSPSPSSSSPSPSSSSPTKRSRRSSSVLYAAQKRSHRRKTTPYAIDTRHDDAFAPSTPIVAIRRGGSPPVANGIPRSSPPQRSPRRGGSPLQQHILSKVRAAKVGIETPDSGARRRSALLTPRSDGFSGTPTKSPLFSPGGNANAVDGDYCVDLSSFTGTLHISAPNNQYTTIQSPRPAFRDVDSPRAPRRGQAMKISSSSTVGFQPRSSSPRKRSHVSGYDISKSSSIVAKRSKVASSTLISTDG